MVEILTDQESGLLELYDSRYFGFLRLTEPICDNLDITHKSLLTKGLRYYENALLKDGAHANPNIYCKLGHFHLLLEDYVKALSAYQKFFSVQGDYWKDAPFLYGLGIVYFHYGAYMWTIKAFQQVLYLDPGFTRSNEIHLKLGMMFKMQGNYEASMKHFHQALLDSHPCSLSKFERTFAQRTNMTKVKLITYPQEYFDMLTADEIEVIDGSFVSDDVIELRYEHKYKFMEPNAKTNVVTAAFTTAHARLKLYNTLEQLGERVLYDDTDSVIYASKAGEPEPETGVYFGELTDEQMMILSRHLFLEV